MRISDWSSDVCSSDLVRIQENGGGALLLIPRKRILSTARRLSRRRFAYIFDDLLPELRPLRQSTSERRDKSLVALPDHGPCGLGRGQIGRASGRERVCRYVSHSVGPVPLKKKKKS